MDTRVRQHAELLVNYSTAVDAEDNVLIQAPVAAEDLVVALYESLGEQGARPTVTWRNPRASRAYMRAVDPDDIRTKDHELGLMERTDVVILVKASRNSAETSDVPHEAGTAASRAKQPILEERLDTRWVITQHPTPADAQRAGMSTAAWTDYVYDAICRDWENEHDRQARVAERLDDGETLRLTAGAHTDLTASIAGMVSYNDDATENVPGGEVATSPVVDGVTGTVAVDFPVRRHGREMTGIHLEFEDGIVVDAGADRNEDVLDGLLETDGGARRVGEVGIGTNRGIDRISHDPLFDEKMAGTVHIALGRAMEECVPDGRTFNESAVHQDMLVDVRDDARLTIDGDVVLQNGMFWFEDGF